MQVMPTWEEFLIPTVRVLVDGQLRHRRNIYALVADNVDLTDENRNVTLASGQKQFENRIGFALSFLTNVGALVRPARGQYAVTAAGKELIARFPTGAREHEIRALGEDPSSPIREYVATVPRTTERTEPEAEESVMTPTEQVQAGISRIHDQVASELLTRLQGKDPAFFEDAVVQLLLAMGYGGTSGTGSVTGISNDGGIDGVIDQDVLGLSRVYVQAKRYADNNVVQRPEVQGFVGAVHGRADGGVFITTSRFSQGAKDFVASTPVRIVLIDGSRLVELMIKYGVGVQVRRTYNIVEVDEDFFE